MCSVYISRPCFLDFQAEQTFVICEALYEDSEAEDNPMTKQMSGTCRFLGLQRGNLSVTAK